MHLVDTHAHLFPPYCQVAEIKGILDKAFRSDIRTVINVGTDVINSKVAAELTTKYDNLYAAVGLHPHDAATATADIGKELLDLISRHPKVVAIGEIGLDYHYDNCSPEKQRAVLQELLNTAAQKDLPVILHVRNAWEDIFPIIESSGISPAKLVFHCFTGPKEVTEHISKIGSYISLTGIITFPSFNSNALEGFPLERIMLETDSPYLTPVPYRGKPNAPEYISLIAEKLANIKQVPIETIADVTTNTAKCFFKIST